MILRVADRLLLMAHDYHQASVPSPPTPLLAVAQAVRALIDANVEPSRIILGISLSAQQWVLDRRRGAVKWGDGPAYPAGLTAAARPSCSGRRPSPRCWWTVGASGSGQWQRWQV